MLSHVFHPFHQVVQGLAMMSAMLGTLIILLAFFAGLFMTTAQLLDQHAPELCYSVAAGAADVPNQEVFGRNGYVKRFKGLNADETGWHKCIN